MRMPGGRFVALGLALLLGGCARETIEQAAESESGPPPPLLDQEPARALRGPRHAAAGMPAPRVTLPLGGGGKLDLSARPLPSRFVLVFAAEAPPAEVASALGELARADGNEARPVLIGPAGLSVAAEGWQVAVDQGGGLAQAFLVDQAPTTLLVDNTGLIVTARPQALDAKLVEALEGDLEAVRQGPEVALAIAHFDGRAERPIPAGPKAYTAADLWAVEQRFMRRRLVEAYQSIGRRDPAWDKPALALLSALAEDFSVTGTERGMALAKPLLDSPCDDPAVRYAVGSTLRHSGSPEAALPHLLQAVEGYKQVPYSRQIAWWAPSAAASVLGALSEQERQAAEVELNRRMKKDPKADVSDLAGPLGADPPDAQRAELAELRLDWIAAGAAEPFDPGEQRLYYRDVNGIRFTNNDEYGRIVERLMAVDADPWLTAALAGAYEVELAWDARGTGIAATVDEGGWHGFEAHLTRAREQCGRAYALQPTFPEPATEMIAVTGGGHRPTGETERLWFDRGVAGQLDHSPLYDRVRNFMLPRWGGTPAASLALARECTATERYDTAVPWQAFALMRNLSTEPGYGDIWQQDGVYPLLERVLDTYASQADSEEYRMYYRSLLAAVAFQAGEREDVAALLGDASPTTVLDALERYSNDNDRLEVVYGRFAYDVGRLEASTADHYRDAVIEGYESLRWKVDSELAQASVVRALARLRKQGE